ncbi:MAG: hypothetical protein ABFR50_05810 [Candidatus Fermentibacteria bacterium]
MKSIQILAVFAAVLLAACGAQPEERTAASSLDVLPEASLFSIAVVNPAIVLSSLDGYASGVAVLGENALSGWILSALDCADMAEVENRLGVDIDGSLVFFMESMMPQSLGAALTVTDPDIFWTNIGITPEPGDQLEGYDVSKIAVDFGNIYFCHTDGLLLGAGSRAGLKNMLENIDGNYPSNLPGTPDGSFYIHADIESFGPIVAGQLGMLEPQILAGMSADGDMNMDIMQNMIGLYFDVIRLVLTETRSVDCVLSFEADYITGTSATQFVPGSSLDEYIIPVDVEDLTPLIPAGNIVVGRGSIDPSTSTAALNAIFNALNLEGFPQSLLAFWAEAASNTAMSMTFDPDNPMHIVAVYEMPEGTQLADVMEAYELQFSMMSEFMDIPGLTLADVQYAEYAGLEWVTFGMNMDMAAMIPDSIPDNVPMAENVNWTAWMTVQDGILYMEMAAEPITVSLLLDGTYLGQTASDMPEMQHFSSSAEMAMLINIPGYLNMAIGMSGLDMPPIDSDPVWLEMEVDFTGGGINQHFRVSGREMSAFIAQAIGAFGAMSQ